MLADLDRARRRHRQRRPAALRQLDRAGRAAPPRRSATCGCTGATTRTGSAPAPTGNQRYDYLYTADELRPWVERIREIAARPTIREMYAVTNNHHLGKAPANGAMIEGMLWQRKGARCRRRCSPATGRGWSRSRSPIAPRPTTASCSRRLTGALYSIAGVEAAAIVESLRPPYPNLSLSLRPDRGRRPRRPIFDPIDPISTRFGPDFGSRSTRRSGGRRGAATGRC